MRLTDRDELVRLMDRQGWTVRSLAKACGLRSHGMIQQLRKGTKTSCTVELAVAIADRLKVAPGLLFEVQTSNTVGQNVPVAS